MHDITVGQQQRVEILKALYRGADILILDEPTAVLTPQEAQELFAILRSLTEQGKSIIFISHKLNEVLEIADRITVLRRGKKIETLPAAGATEAEARAADGRTRGAPAGRQEAAHSPATRSLVVEDLRVVDDREIEQVRGVSFEVRAGEIVGIAGVDGNGQTELIDAITGLRRPQAGAGHGRRRGHHERERARLRSTRASATSPRTGSGAGSCSTSRSRRTSPCTTTTTRRRPASAGSTRGGWSSGARKLIRRVRRPRRRPADARRRALGRQPAEGRSSRARSTATRRVLIAAQPTRGLDVGAIEFVHRRLVEERDEGRGVLLVSLELEEILSLSDRILVIFEGRIVGEFPPGVTEEELGVAMIGGGRQGGGLSEPKRGAPREQQRPAAVAARAAAGARHRADGRRAERRRAARARPEGGRARRPAPDDAPRLPDRRPRRPRHDREEPAQDVQGDLRGQPGSTGSSRSAPTSCGSPFTDAYIPFPWNTNDFESLAALNLQQTLILWVPLVLTGLAVAFAFRCGMFNIGGQGQYLVGRVIAVWLGSSLPGLPGLVHVLACDRRGRAGRRGLGGHRRPPQGAPSAPTR